MEATKIRKTKDFTEQEGAETTHNSDQTAAHLLSTVYETLLCVLGTHGRKS